MIRHMLTGLALSLAWSAGWAQTPTTPATDSTKTLDEVVISSSLAKSQTPITTTDIDRKELEDGRIETSLPFMVDMTPSVVASGENGQVGNTSIRIRGVDGTRVNVNINGIPLNDAESQMVYWVNLPNLAGMAQKIQIQRGIGSSTGGSASLGGTINLQTLNAQASPYGVADLSVGSWNTRQYGVTAGTGITKHGFALDLAYNGLTTDGYVRNGFCDHQSLFVSGSHFGERSVLKALAIIGSQHTGITWDGASAEELDRDPTYNPAGAYYDPLGGLHYYDNQSDNYKQRHYQIYYSFSPSQRWTLNTAADITRGSGYYEQFFAGGRNSYAFALTDTGDCVARMQMENTAYTGRIAAQYASHLLELSMGTTVLYYDGKQFGNVIWSQTGNDSGHWYDNIGQKGDVTTFVRANFALPAEGRNPAPLNLYADLQLRYVDYRISGIDEDCSPLDFREHYLFFNPQVGMHYDLRPSKNDIQQSVNFVVGASHREPTRADIKDALHHADTVKAEAMTDIEAGYRLQFGSKSKGDNYLKIGGYAMLYKDQLTASGRLSEAGYALMENVDRSYRIGVEMEGSWQTCSWLLLSGNLCLSRNKIIDYQYSYTDFSGNTFSESLGTTDLAFSPNTVAGLSAAVNPWKQLRLQLTAKYVGRMYCDNTSRQETQQQDYCTLNLKSSYLWKLPNGSEIEAQLQINNLLNRPYRIGAWVADYGSDGLCRGFYQQPGINLTARIIVRL